MTGHDRVLPVADRDFDDQADYLATPMPGIGERRPSANPRLAGLRVWRIDGFEKHLIFYRPGAGDIEIVRVIPGARDIERVLESGPAE